MAKLDKITRLVTYTLTLSEDEISILRAILGNFSRINLENILSEEDKQEAVGALHKMSIGEAEVIIEEFYDLLNKEV